MPRGVPNQKPADDLVAPIESVDEAPQTGGETYTSPFEHQEAGETTTATDPCWNCGNQLQSGRCDECGFDKSLIFNLDLEAEQAAVRQLNNSKE